MHEKPGGRVWPPSSPGHCRGGGAPTFRKDIPVGRGDVDPFAVRPSTSVLLPLLLLLLLFWSTVNRSNLPRRRRDCARRRRSQSANWSSCFIILFGRRLVFVVLKKRKENFYFYYYYSLPRCERLRAASPSSISVGQVGWFWFLMAEKKFRPSSP